MITLKPGEQLLKYLIHADDSEAIIGDFLEMYADAVRENGRFPATLSFWQQLIKSTPALTLLRIKRSQPMKNWSQHGNQLALIGIILMLPAILLAFGGVMQSLFGIYAINNALSPILFDGPLRFLIHPIIVMGGVIIALGINLRSVIHVKLQRQDGALVSTITLQTQLWNLALIGLCLALGGIIFLYALAENFGIFAR